MDTLTPPPTRSSHPSPVATSSRASNASNLTSVEADDLPVVLGVTFALLVDPRLFDSLTNGRLLGPGSFGSYTRESELFPNVISGSGRLSLFSTLVLVRLVVSPVWGTYASISFPFKIGRLVAVMLHLAIRIVVECLPFRTSNAGGGGTA